MALLNIVSSPNNLSSFGKVTHLSGPTETPNPPERSRRLLHPGHNRCPHQSRLQHRPQRHHLPHHLRLARFLLPQHRPASSPSDFVAKPSPSPASPWVPALAESINAIALVFLVPFFIFCFFPIATPVERETMNWNIAMFGAIFLIANIFYVVKGRKTYVPPVRKVKRDI